VDGVAPEDFEQLLWVFYNPCVTLSILRRNFSCLTFVVDLQKILVISEIG